LSKARRYRNVSFLITEYSFVSSVIAAIGKTVSAMAGKSRQHYKQGENSAAGAELSQPKLISG
jgi:hypothetical protein